MDPQIVKYQSYILKYKIKFNIINVKIKIGFQNYSKIS